MSLVSILSIVTGDSLTLSGVLEAETTTSSKASPSFKVMVNVWLLAVTSWVTA